MPPKMRGGHRNQIGATPRRRGGPAIAVATTAAASTETAYNRMRRQAEKMRFDRTGLIPQNVHDYTSIKGWYGGWMGGFQDVKKAQNDLDLQIAKAQGRDIAQVFGGRTFGNGNVGVLGLQTVWARGWKPSEDHPEAPWPSPREFREEGDERHTSNYGRFLPLPRLPGNSTVVYKQKSWNTIEALDLVMPVPKICGMVNPLMYGFEEVEVDIDGIPFDDPDLPGQEYIVTQADELAGSAARAYTARIGRTFGQTPGRKMLNAGAEEFVASPISMAGDLASIAGQGLGLGLLNEGIAALNVRKLVKDAAVRVDKFTTPVRKQAIQETPTRQQAAQETPISGVGSVTGHRVVAATYASVAKRAINDGSRKNNLLVDLFGGPIASVTDDTKMPIELSTSPEHNTTAFVDELFRGTPVKEHGLAGEINGTSQCKTPSPDVIRFTNPWKAKHKSKGLRINTNIKESYSNASVEISPKGNSIYFNGSEPVFTPARPNVEHIMNMSPGPAFGLIGVQGHIPILGSHGHIGRESSGSSQLMTAVTQKDSDTTGSTSPHEGLTSPLEFRKTTSFSKGKPRGRIPSPLHLKPAIPLVSSSMVSTPGIDTDSTDGGVMLNDTDFKTFDELIAEERADLGHGLLTC